MTSIQHYEGGPAQVPAMSEREWAGLERTAAVLAKSGMVKPAFRDKPEAVMAVAVSLYQLGLPVTLPTLAMFDFYEGEARPRVALSIAFAQSHGHQVWLPDEECNDEQAVCYGQRAGDSRVHRVTVTAAQFKNLANKDNWKNYRADMLKWRAASRLLKTVMGDTMLGLPPAAAAALAGEGVPPVPAGIDAETGEVLPIIDVPAEDEDDDLFPPNKGAVDKDFVRRFIKACKDITPEGIDEEDFRRALVSYATGGRVDSARIVERGDEAKAVQATFIAVRDGKARVVSEDGDTWVEAVEPKAAE